MLLVATDIAVVVAVSVGIGASAPHWPPRWLSRDAIPLAPWETPRYFRAWGATRLARLLPELGAAFGGSSKAHLPGRDRLALESYLREVRRAELVHWCSIASTLPLYLFNPWWLALMFTVVVTLGNLPFLLVLRYNRYRLLRLLEAVT